MDGYSVTEDKALTHHVVMGIIGISFLILASFSGLFSFERSANPAFHLYDVYWLSFTGMGLIFMGAAVVTTVCSWETLSAATKRVVLISVAAMIGILLFQIFFELFRSLSGAVL
jgi:hypothetical protein